MSGEAWFFMAAVWAIVIGNTLYCFRKLLTSKRKLDGD
jgi:hypothetical protein